MGACHRVLLSTTMLASAFIAYGRRAYGACALVTPPSTFECSGANVVQQTIATNNADVSTLAGFSVVTGDLRAVSITAAGDLSYTDANASTLTAAAIGATALFIQSTGDDGLTPGSVTVDTNGVLIGGGYGIRASNYGGGALSITANGAVTGGNNTAIRAENFAAGTDLSVTAAGTVFGNFNGIFARNYGSGALSVTANSDATGRLFYGIYARNYGTDLSVTTGAGTAGTGANSGILARNDGSGALTVTANGDATAANSKLRIFLEWRGAMMCEDVCGSGFSSLSPDLCSGFFLPARRPPSWRRQTPPVCVEVTGARLRTVDQRAMLPARPGTPPS